MAAASDLSPMTLYGGPHSPFVRKVVVTAAEIGALPHIQFLRVNPPASMAAPNPTLMAINPLAKVPALVCSNDFVLFDSDVICEFLDATFGKGDLYPLTGVARWRALRWNALGSGGMEALVLWRFERTKPSEEQSAKVIRTFEGKVAAILGVSEAELSQLSADTFGIGHIAIACFLGYLDHRFAELEWRASRPLLAKWMDKISGRESFVISRHGDPQRSDQHDRSKVNWS